MKKLTTQKSLKQQATLAVSALEIEYPDALCSLLYTNPLQLLIATRLSAQCTDARVNIVTPALFERFKTVDDFCNGTVEEIEKYIHSCGLYKTKAKDIYNMCVMIRDDFGGVVPDNIDDLTKLSGIGRKTANLIMGDIYGQPAYVCDTHCIRITNRLGLTQGKDALKVEMQLRKILDPEKSNAFCHRMVLHGRAVCQSRTPKCENCCMKDFCLKVDL